MAETNSEEFDVVVVGGGPAGSSVASFVAMQGRRVLLLEKETFPRYQIGESLLPSTVLGICRVLGVSEEIDKAGFVVKHGGRLKWGANPDVWGFDFSDVAPSSPQEIISYQVERMKFDDILLKNAQRLGVDVREGCAVSAVLGDAERVRGVRYVDGDGNERTAASAFVVDASGNGSRLYRSVASRRQYSEFFRNIALFGYFEGGKRLPAPNSGNILCEAFDDGWFWYIPLSDTLTSVGAVIRHELAEEVRGDREKALMKLIAKSPIVSDFLSDAKRVTEGVYGQIRVRKDYSYSADRYWRPGMVLVGDAACFVDPVLSTGVHLATYSALLAARSINSVLAGRIDEPTAFGEFESRYRREYGNFHEFLVAFYDTHVDESSYFWKAKKVTNYPAPDIEAFVRLVSGVASGEGALDVAAHGDGRNGRSDSDAPDAADAGAPSGDWDVDMNIRFNFFSPQHQVFGASRWIPGGIDGQGPRPSGLVASADGMHWAVPA